MLKKTFHIVAFLLTAIIMVGLLTLPVQAEVSGNYLYRLSDFSGPVGTMWARLAVDPAAGEVYSLDRSEGDIRIFNQNAMQTFGFGEGLRLASAVDIAAGEGGELFVLYRFPSSTVRHLDYRGEPVRDITIQGGQVAASFQPEFLDYRDGHLYLADSSSMQVVVATTDGDIVETHDFRSLIAGKIKDQAAGKDVNEAQRKSLQKDLETLSGALFNGFCVDPAGNFFFTIASFFSAYRWSPQQEQLEAFGTPGSAPGKFGVVASITADQQGNVYVSDRLRSVVLIFDNSLAYQAEFGYRGSKPHNLTVPDDVVIDERHNRIYVAQAAGQGVSVFSLRRE